MKEKNTILFFCLRFTALTESASKRPCRHCTDRTSTFDVFRNDHIAPLPIRLFWAKWPNTCDYSHVSRFGSENGKGEQRQSTDSDEPYVVIVLPQLIAFGPVTRVQNDLTACVIKAGLVSPNLSVFGKHPVLISTLVVARPNAYFFVKTINGGRRIDALL